MLWQQAWQNDVSPNPLKGIAVNSASLVLSKLSELVDLAFSAGSDFEKAAVFSATTTLIGMLETEFDDTRAHAMENVERLRWSICAMVGYDIDNGHDNDRHKSWAHAAVTALEDSLLR
jgi:hypothetical protein